jgi:hypothetical protein
MRRVKETNDPADAGTDNPGGRTDRNHCGAATAEKLAGRVAAWASGGFCSPPDGDWIDRMLSSRARARHQAIDQSLGAFYNVRDNSFRDFCGWGNLVAKASGRGPSQAHRGCQTKLDREGIALLRLRDTEAIPETAHRRF